MTSSANTTIPNNNFVSNLEQIGLKATAQNLDDLISRATKARWAPRAILEELYQIESRGGSGSLDSYPKELSVILHGLEGSSSAFSLRRSAKLLPQQCITPRALLHQRF